MHKYTHSIPAPRTASRVLQPYSLSAHQGPWATQSTRSQPRLVNTGLKLASTCRPCHPTCHNVCHQVSVQVWCDHNVKLVWPADQLHAGVVHNHLSVLNVGVLGCNSLSGLGNNNNKNRSSSSSSSSNMYSRKGECGGSLVVVSVKMCFELMRAATKAFTRAGQRRGVCVAATTGYYKVATHALKLR